MKKFLLALIILGIVLFGGYYWRSVRAPGWSEEEMKAKHEELSGKKLDEELVKEQEVEFIEGKYVSFGVRVPRYVLDDEAMKQNGKVLEGYKFYGGVPKVMVVLMVESSGDGNRLTDNPGVLLRLNEKEKYTSNLDEKDGHEAVIFLSDREKSAFWFGNGRSFSLVVSGGEREKVSGIFDEVWQSLRIR